MEERWKKLNKKRKLQRKMRIEKKEKKVCKRRK